MHIPHIPQQHEAGRTFSEFYLNDHALLFAMNRLEDSSCGLVSQICNADLLASHGRDLANDVDFPAKILRGKNCRDDGEMNQNRNYVRNSHATLLHHVTQE